MTSRDRPSRRDVLRMVGVGGAAILSTGLIGACSQASAPAPAKPEPATGKPAAKAEEAKPAAPAAAPAAASKPGEIVLDVSSFQWSEPGNRKWWEAVTTAFNAAHAVDNIKVTGSPIPQGAYLDQTVVRLQAGNPQPIITGNVASAAAYAALGKLEPLDRWLDKTDIRDRFVSAQSSPPAKAKDGKTYLLMTQHTATAMAFNKQMLDEAGLKAPTTHAELLDAAQKLTKRDGNQVVRYGYAFPTPPVPYAFNVDLTVMMVTFGGAWSKDGVYTCNDPKNVEAVSFIRDMHRSGAVPRQSTQEGFRQMFWEGKVAIVHDVVALIGFIGEANPTMLPNLGTAVPFGGRTIGQPFGIMMAKDIPEAQKEAAWKFMEFTTRPENQKLVAELSGSIPPMKGVLTDEFMQSRPYFKAYVDGAANNPEPLVRAGLERYHPQLQKEAVDALGEVLFNDRTPKDALDALQKRMEEIVKG